MEIKEIKYKSVEVIGNREPDSANVPQVPVEPKNAANGKQIPKKIDFKYHTLEEDDSNFQQTDNIDFQMNSIPNDSDNKNSIASEKNPSNESQSKNSDRRKKTEDKQITNTNTSTLNNNKLEITKTEIQENIQNIKQIQERFRANFLDEKRDIKLGKKIYHTFNTETFNSDKQNKTNELHNVSGIVIDRKDISFEVEQAEVQGTDINLMNRSLSYSSFFSSGEPNKKVLKIIILGIILLIMILLVGYIILIGY